MIVQRLLALGFALLAAAFTTALPAVAQTPEARFAFVIGNDGYEAAPLKTAANDAGLVAETLRGAGFDVTGARNLDQETLRASFREFLDKVAAAGPNAVAAIYLSGHGLQVEGENYLVPVGARVQRDTDVNLNAVRISDLLRALGGIPAKARIAMLDLANDNPFAKEGQPLAPGLEIVEATNGMLVGFNAAPGTVAPKADGNYGPYAQALSETMRIPGLPLDEVFARVRTRTAELTQGKQVPWHASRLDPNFVLLEGAPNAPEPSVTAKQIQDARAKPIREYSDAEAYSAAIDRDTITAYQEFLTAFPQSRYAPAVRGLIAARREALTWRRTTNVNTPNAYWSYLKRYPKGPHAPDARRRLARLSAPTEAPSSFDAIPYDVAPPPDAEDVYFERDTPTYFVDALPPPRSAYMPPPPAWWAPPPPPPEDIYEETYFLPTPMTPPPPPWVRPPAYVVDAPEFYRSERRGNGGGASIIPYVAIPAALAAGIAAGKLLDRARRPDQQGGQPRPNGAGPGQNAVVPGGAPTRPNFIPPVTQAPRPLTQIQQQQGTVGQPVQRQPPQPQPLNQQGVPLPQGAAPQTPPPAGRPVQGQPNGQPGQGQPLPPGAQRPGGPQGGQPPQQTQQTPSQPALPGQTLQRPGTPPAPNQLPPGQTLQRPGNGPQQGQPPSLPAGAAPTGARPGVPTLPQQPGQPPQLQQQPSQVPAGPRPVGQQPPNAQQQQQQIQRQQEQQRVQDQQRMQEQQRLQQQRQQQIQQQQLQQQQIQRQQQQQIQRQQEQQRQQQQQIQRQQQLQQQQQQIQRQQQQQQQQQIQRQQQIQQQQQMQRQQPPPQQQQQQQQQRRPTCGLPGLPPCPR